MWIVKWRVKHNGFSGHGSPITYQAAKDAVKYANDKYPGIDHWVESVDSRDEEWPDEINQDCFNK